MTGYVTRHITFPYYNGFKLQGVATIVAGDTSVTVTHNQNAKLKKLYPTSSLSGYGWAVTSEDLNGFTITIDSPLLVDVFFNYGV